MATKIEREAVRAAMKQAREFATPEALQQYLKMHPKADPSRHTVVENGGGGKAEEEGRGKKPPPIPDEAKKKKTKPPPIPEAAKKQPKKDDGGSEKTKKDDGDKGGDKRFDNWKKKFKNLSEKAQAFVENSKSQVKQFVGDEEFRKHALKEAGNAIKKSPKKFVSNLIEVAKHEKHEFELAGKGVAALMKGGKMTKKQKHAFQQVMTHMTIAGSAAAFTATGPLAGVGLFAKGLATHVAAKAGHKSLANLHLMQELGHIGHGVMHLLEHVAAEGESKPTKGSPEEAMANLALALVSKEIENLSDEDIAEVLEQMDEAQEGEGEEEANQKLAHNVLKRFSKVVPR